VIELTEVEDGCRFRANEAVVGQVTLGEELRIVIFGRDGESAEITIATPFRVQCNENGAHANIDPEADDPSLGQLILSLRKQPLIGGMMSTAGTLALEFGGCTIDVPPDVRYEAWAIDARQFKIVAVPGDELAIWRR
jgi:uncharacterized protein DUF6188